MIEKNISLENINPIDFFGVGDDKLKALKDFFPHLNISARGNEIFFSGQDKFADLFENKIKLLIEHFNEYNSLSLSNLKRIVLDRTEEIENIDDNKNIILFGNKGKIIRPRTNNQKKLVDKLTQNDLVFAFGPAGTGKTYIAIAVAVKALKNKEVKRIVLTRPAVEAGENLGFLPGDMKEKIDPYLQPLFDALADMIPSLKLSELFEKNIIQIAPLAFMRGRTLDDAYVILDEAQNTSSMQMKMFLTRMGPSAKFVITGDMSQVDLPKQQKSGLVHAYNLLKKIDGVGFVQFKAGDIVRHRLVKEIVIAYDNEAEGI